jgi:hypothetical protein
MIDELEYNLIVAEELGPKIKGDTFAKAAGLFRDDQFVRAISQGAVSILDDKLKNAIFGAYAGIGELKQLTTASIYQTARDHTQGGTNSQVIKCLAMLPDMLQETRNLLLSFLGGDVEHE